MEFLGQVAKLVAVAVDNVLHHQALSDERDRLQLLLDVTESIASHRDFTRLLEDLAGRCLKSCRSISSTRSHMTPEHKMRLWLLVTSAPSTIQTGLETPIEESPGGLGVETQQPLTVNDVAQEESVSRPDVVVSRERGAGLLYRAAHDAAVAGWAPWGSAVSSPGPIRR